ncbi:MAG: phytase [Bdellovibrionales bacterium]|nr:phytase [Bdellovibrionales bacterium]
MIIFFILMGLFFSFKKVPNYPVEVQATFETTPVPMGTHSSDDTAIWLHPNTPEKSLIFGVNKNKKKRGGKGGIGLYDLEGKEVTFYQEINGEVLGRINNIDLRYGFKKGTEKIDILAASNRSKRNGDYTGTSLFEIKGNEKELKLLGHFPIVNSEGEHLEPYGLCMGKDNDRYYVFSLLENGELYKHQIKFVNSKITLEPISVLRVSDFINKRQDSITVEMVTKDVLVEYQQGEFESDQLPEELVSALEQRHQMEGCVGDDFHKELYFGVEKLGIFKVPYNSNKPQLVAEISKSKNDTSNIFLENEPRLTDDIEGMALYHGPNGAGYLVVSVQGLSEFIVFSRGKLNTYLGSFKVNFLPKDSVTQTDGFEILSSYLGKNFPKGLMAIHDHENTNSDGKVLKANYKFLSFSKVLKKLELTDFKLPYNPRK